MVSGRRYEVAVRRDERWVIDCLAFNEAEARARADELYTDESVMAVRVVRGRFGRDGTSFETVIHQQDRPGTRKEPPVRIATSPSHDAWCETLSDLYGPASRRAIAQLLRNFLDRFAITPTELLHYHRYIRLLERQDELLPHALQRIASLQARARGGDARQRLETLNRLASDASCRAREALKFLSVPQLGPGGLAELHTAAASLPANQAFYVRFAVSRALEDVGGAVEKFDLVGRWAQHLSDPAVPLVDELCAGLLGAASVLQETLGPQPHLAAALGTMADLAFGRASEKIAPRYKPFLALLADARLPETRLVLTERIACELAGDKPLSRDDAAGQRRLFEGLLEKLVHSGLFVGGSAMVEAIARRSRNYDIIGGVEAVRFTSPDPLGRIDQLADLTAKTAGQRQLQAIAGYLMELLDTYAGDPTALAPIRVKIESSGLPTAAKAALLERFPYKSRD
jgi:hypothetical protein